ncbi:nuclease-related domain-containing protein [Bacillus sp. FJAT-22090]|uniref:nuclease-related domain-containing protein n=1 Tax=Bacillus sp. FJAT-22090 TaxID=1581038 RepID=UPI0011A13E29|nr:nuclease-related domain-containing protein [Bacillus sp. FJAT-22090]
MIVKKYSKSIHIEAMKLLIRRLHTSHSLYEKVMTAIHAATAGEFGEEMVFRELERMRLPYKYHVYHKLLLHSERSFELDILLITPFGAVIFEVKNITGEIEFQENPSQIIQRKENGEINKYPCPVTQLKGYKAELAHFFNDHNISIPIYGAIVFASHKSYVRVSNNQARILYKNEIIPYLLQLQKKSPILNDEEMENVKNILLNKNTPFTYFPLTKYFSINPNELLRGVECPECHYVGMRKIKRTWECPKCGQKDIHAYKEALASYFLIYKNSITNKECRDFLKLNNRHEATRILSNENLIKVGNKKSTYYKMKPFNNR